MTFPNMNYLVTYAENVTSAPLCEHGISPCTVCYNTQNMNKLLLGHQTGQHGVSLPEFNPQFLQYHSQLGYNNEIYAQYPQAQLSLPSSQVLHCRFCDETFCDMVDLNIHTRHNHQTHKDQSITTDSMAKCDTSSISETVHTDHIQNEHVDSSMFISGACDDNFQSGNALQKPPTCQHSTRNKDIQTPNVNASYSKDSDKTLEIATDSNKHISEYHDHVVSFPPIPQLDGVDDMLNIISQTWK